MQKVVLSPDVLEQGVLAVWPPSEQDKALQRSANISEENEVPSVSP